MKKDKKMEAIIMLNALIQEKRSELVSYAAKPGAKDGYINKQNAFLSRLTTARDLIPPLYCPELWLQAESEFSRLSSIDPGIAVFGIDFRIKESGSLSKIYLNLY